MTEKQSGYIKPRFQKIAPIKKIEPLVGPDSCSGWQGGCCYKD